ncbi:MAG: phosphatase domain-containing protein [Oculatellaceae cyanobacterium bins.114]|nr:phosphatase domain-containing protein [Oculatellaceae cyanobacterium bins.114]
MTNWIWTVSNLMSRFNAELDQIKQKVAEKLGTEDPISILPYYGYGTSKWLRLKGRVLQDQGIKRREEDAPLWQNVRNMYRRFESDEVPHARLRVTYGDLQQEVTTNQEGFFEVEISLASSLKGNVKQSPLNRDRSSQDVADPDASNPHWETIHLELLEPTPTQPQPYCQPVCADGGVFIVTDRARFGVISDIDDTIVPTAATNLIKMIRLAYLGNEHTRSAFPGIPAFYQALQAGHDEDEGNPIFYLSSSAWNMYDLFSKFIALNDLPAGPILLCDAELSLANLVSFEHETHKIEQMTPLFERFPHLPWILIGDTGQKDAEIYSQMVHRYPGRILAIYLHDVTPDQSDRQRELEAIAKTVRQAGSEWVLFSDTVTAATHAAKQGWILPSTLSNVSSPSSQER